MKEFVEKNEKLAYIIYLTIGTIALYISINFLVPIYFLNTISKDEYNYFFYFLSIYIIFLVSFPAFVLYFNKTNKDKKNNIFKFIVVYSAFSLIASFQFFLLKDKLFNNGLELRYSYLNEEIITSNNNIEPKTKEYIEFKNYMKERNLEKVTFYSNNLPKFKNIGKDKTFELIMAMKSINDKNIKDKINTIYSDKFISEEEYSEFKSFILEQDLDSEYIAFLNL